jgi:hypothetical protein
VLRHVLDCKAISASLEKHLEQHPDDPHPIIVEKLRLIGDFIAYAEADAPLSAARIFSLIPVNYQTWRLGHSDVDCQGRRREREIASRAGLSGDEEKLKINQLKYMNHIKS